ncbi:hypothetical protein G6N82_10380 [Altererythrobacter sp. BO-6]|uniref:competence protein CoiA n=1 Tax=Altererythrobacter sp. BO-6 TaxID=2604537 RepID=UPI0013E12AD3|nr:competence protein CoiA family protein [Altererythrobacter sp. BO-6]QIG54502.1 hypothetical protein G6N82_10380 [Altererythrobacter sp. BO-6]
MPLSCLDEKNNRIHAFDLTAEQWDKLKIGNRKLKNLRMPCCESLVVLKKSRRGTRFFAHSKVGRCLTADEGEEHRVLKSLAVDVARECGWSAETEVSGSTPDGEHWRADVLATKGSAMVAIEVQWSGQVNDETLRRQDRYQQSGIRGLWLLRQPGFPVSQDLPAACIGGSLDEGFHALIPYRWSRMSRSDRQAKAGWKVVTPMADFIRAALSKRLRWGRITDIGASAEAQVLIAEADCEACGVITDIIVGIELDVAGEKVDVSLLDLTPHDALIEELRLHLPQSFDQSHLKVRFSRTRKERYLSNGCLGCDRLYGDFYLSQYREVAKVACRFPVKLAGDWLRLFQESDDWADGQPEWWLIPDL